MRRVATARPRPVAVTLLALGLLASGCGDTESAPEAPGDPWFADVTAASGIDFVYRSGHAQDFLMPEIMGGGAALFDMDGDGDLDAYLVQGGDLRTPKSERRSANQLYANRGDGVFDDVTDQSGADDRGYGMGVACGDVDGDGLADLYVTNVGANALLVGDGRGHFTERSDDVDHDGWGTSAAFFDYDRDGHLDLYVVNYLAWSSSAELPCYNRMSRPDYCSPKNYEAPAADVLYRGLGDGRFEDVSGSSGVRSVPGNGLGVGCGDFDDDGWTDVFVANDGNPDVLWRNAGDGTFRDVAAAWGCAVDEDGLYKAGMGVAVADVDIDGDLDVLVCNLERESDSLHLNGGGFFSDRTARAGLGTANRPYTRFGMAWFDFDHDGFLDLFQVNGRVNRQSTQYGDDPYAEPDLLMIGTGPAQFRTAEPAAGTPAPILRTSRAAAFGDVDGDGAVDVLVVNRDAPAHLLRNQVGERGHWIVLRPRERSGAPALGATVRFSAGGRARRADVRAAYSYLASNEPSIHVGLGTAATVEDVQVRWADGTLQAFGTLEAGRVHLLRRE